MFSRLNRSRGSRHRQQYESLETRRLLAGDVTVFEFGDNLYLRGDQNDNQVQVFEEGGEIRIAGLDGTTINGQSNPFVIPAEDGQLNGGFRANLGRGNDSLFFEEVNVQGSAVVYGGAGDDSIGFFNASVRDTLFAQTFRGDDAVSIDDVDVGGNLTVVTHNGDDLIGIDETTVGGRTILLTGSGDDDLAIQDSTHQGNVYAFTYGGDDFVGIDNVNFGGFAGVLTGFGSDDVYVNDSNFGGRTYVNGGFRSNDNLEVDGETSLNANTTAVGFEGDDVAGGMLQTDQVFTDLIVDGSRLGTITELAALTPELSTLVGALEATGLDSALVEDGDFTVFAPLNSAFDDISDVVDSLTLDQLSQVLQFHVTTPAIFSGRLVMMSSVDTLLGQSFSVEVLDGDVILNGNATLAATDIRAKNGVIHLLNNVLVPVL
ncbi:MAG: fasciclin domain-containing protein [Planctomycetota bacterium]